MLSRNPFLFTSAFILFAGSLSAQFKAAPKLSPASPQLVAAPVTITFGYTGSVQGPVTFRFEVQAPQSTNFQIIKDYDQEPSFLWAQSYSEGIYMLRITARDYASGDTSQVVLPYTINSRVTGGAAVVSPTSHPLVALFSAPACPAGSTMKISFSLQNNVNLSYTNSKPCGSGSMNFLVAGMQQQTTYYMNYMVQTGSKTSSGPSVLPFVTGAIAKTAQIAPVQFPVPYKAGATSATEKYQFNSFQGGSQSFAFDLAGNTVWYWPNGQGPQIHRLLADGTYMGSYGAAGDWTGSGVWGHQTKDQLLVNFDMLGNVVQQTSVDRINEQLPAGTDPITHFNHDSFRLPNGNTLAISDVEEVFPAGTQGSTAPIGIIGTMILELDPNYQLLWYWDAFQHDNGAAGNLNINRPATLHDTCVPGGEGCPPVLLTNPSNDWLHTNALQVQADGSLLVSMRDQDWVLDIDFGNGSGTGGIFWRLGLDGDFTMLSSVPYPWFSHQHDAEFHNGTQQLLTVLDNGNTRRAELGGNSRGQALNVDVSAMTATLVENQDLGAFAPGLGSAQILENGDYSFLVGETFTGDGVVLNRNLEYAPAGVVTFESQIAAADYRAFRVADLYRPPNGAGVNQ